MSKRIVLFLTTAACRRVQGRTRSLVSLSNLAYADPVGASSSGGLEADADDDPTCFSATAREDYCFDEINDTLGSGRVRRVPEPDHTEKMTYTMPSFRAAHASVSEAVDVMHVWKDILVDEIDNLASDRHMHIGHNPGLPSTMQHSAVDLRQQQPLTDASRGSVRVPAAIALQLAPSLGYVSFLQRSARGAAHTDIQDLDLHGIATPEPEPVDVTFGEMAQLTEFGYLEVQTFASDEVMTAFVKRLLDSDGKAVISEDDFAGFIPYYSGTKAKQSFAQLKAELAMKPWVVDKFTDEPEEVDLSTDWLQQLNSNDSNPPLSESNRVVPSVEEAQIDSGGAKSLAEVLWNESSGNSSYDYTSGNTTRGKNPLALLVSGPYALNSTGLPSNMSAAVATGDNATQADWAFDLWRPGALQGWFESVLSRLTVMATIVKIFDFTGPVVRAFKPCWIRLVATIGSWLY